MSAFIMIFFVSHDVLSRLLILAYWVRPRQNSPATALFAVIVSRACVQSPEFKSRRDGSLEWNEGSFPPNHGTNAIWLAQYGQVQTRWNSGSGTAQIRLQANHISTVQSDRQPQ